MNQIFMYFKVYRARKQLTKVSKCQFFSEPGNDAAGVLTRGQLLSLTLRLIPEPGGLDLDYAHNLQV